MKMPKSFISFLFKNSLGLLLKAKYWKFMIPFMIAILTIGVSITTSTIDSVQEGSFEPLIVEVGGRITLADENLVKDAELLTSGEGTILDNISFFQKFIGDFFIFYSILFVFIKISKFFLGGTNAPMIIYGAAIFVVCMLQIFFSLLFFQKLTFPMYGVIKSILILIEYAMLL